MRCYMLLLQRRSVSVGDQHLEHVERSDTSPAVELISCRLQQRNFARSCRVRYTRTLYIRSHPFNLQLLGAWCPPPPRQTQRRSSYLSPHKLFSRFLRNQFCTHVVPQTALCLVVAHNLTKTSTNERRTRACFFSMVYSLPFFDRRQQHHPTCEQIVPARGNCLCTQLAKFIPSPNLFVSLFPPPCAFLTARQASTASSRPSGATTWWWRTTGWTPAGGRASCSTAAATTRSSAVSAECRTTHVTTRNFHGL